MALTVAGVEVDVDANTSGLRPQMEAGIEEARRGLQAEVDTIADTSGLTESLKRAAEIAAERAGGEDVEFDAVLTGEAGVTAKAKAIAAKAGGNIKFKTELEGGDRVEGALRKLSDSAKIAEGGSLSLDTRVRLLGRTLASLNTIARSIGLGAIAGSIGPAISGVIALAGGVFQLIAELSRMIPLLAVLPQLGSAVAQVFGVINLASIGVGDALKFAREGGEKFDEALAKLPPAARSFVLTLRDLIPKLDELRNVAAAGLFPGVEDAVRNLSTALFPILRDITKSTAEALGDLAKRGGELASSGPFAADFKAVGESNVRIIKDLGTSGLNFADALRNIIAAASPVLEGLVKLLIPFSELIKANFEASRGTGELQKTIQGAADTFLKVISIIGNVARGLFEIGQASGGTLLTSLQTLTQRFKDFTLSAEGVEKIKGFFESIKPILSALGGLLGDVFKQVGLIGQAGSGPLLVFIEQIRSILPAVLPLLSVFTAVKDAFFAFLVPIIQVAGVIASALVPVIQQLAPLFAQVGELLAGVLIEAFAALMPILPVLVDLIKTLFNAFSPLIPLIGTLLTPIINALIPVIKILSPIVAQVGQVLAGILGEGLKIVAPLFVDLLKVVGEIFQKLAPFIPQLIEVAGILLNSLRGALVAVITALLPLLPTLAELIVALLPPAIKFIELLASVVRVLTPVLVFLAGVLVNALGGAIKSIIPIIEDIGDAFGNVIDFVRSAVDAVERFIRKLLDFYRQLPDFLRPGSPTPFEIAMLGIAKALDEVTKSMGRTVAAAMKLDLPALRELANFDSLASLSQLGLAGPSFTQLSLAPGAVQINADFGIGTDADDVITAMRNVAQVEFTKGLQQVVDRSLAGARPL
ncbi:MAG: phage tail protein [Actinomycetota bacterium]